MKLSTDIHESEDGNASCARLPSPLSQFSLVVRPIGAPIPSQTLPAPAARLSFSPDFYRASIRVDPQDSQGEAQGQGVLPIKGPQSAKSRPQAPHGRRRVVAIARLSRVPSRALLAHRGEVGGALAHVCRRFMRMWRPQPPLAYAWGQQPAWIGMVCPWGTVVARRSPLSEIWVADAVRSAGPKKGAKSASCAER